MAIFLLLLLLFVPLTQLSASYCLTDAQEQTLTKFKNRLATHANRLDTLVGNNTNAQAQAMLLRYTFESKLHAWLSCEAVFSPRDLPRQLRTYINSLRRLSKQSFSDKEIMMYFDDLAPSIQSYSTKSSLSLNLNHTTMGPITANLSAMLSCNSTSNCELGRDAHATNALRGQGQIQSIIRMIDGTLWGTLRQISYTSGVIDNTMMSSTIASLTPLIGKRIFLGDDPKAFDTTTDIIDQRGFDLSTPLPLMHMRETNGILYANPHPAICERLPMMIQADCKRTMIDMNRDLGQQGLFTVSQTEKNTRYRLNPTLTSGTNQTLSFELDQNNVLTRLDIRSDELTIAYQSQKSLSISTPTMTINGRFVSSSPTTIQRRGTLTANRTSSPRTMSITNKGKKSTLTFSLAIPAIEGEINNGLLDFSVTKEPFNGTISKPTDALTIQEAEALISE